MSYLWNLLNSQWNKYIKLLKHIAYDRLSEILNLWEAWAKNLRTIYSNMWGIFLENGIKPYIRTIVVKLGIVNWTRYKYVVAMPKNEMIKYDGKSIETPITKNLNKEIT